MIPKIIHYVWVGPKSVPRKFLDSWISLCPGYKFVFWNEDNIDFSHPFVRSAYAVGAWNRVANFVRANALATYGGFYLDTDIELRRPLDDFRDRECFLGFQVPDILITCCVNNAIMGARPGHWLMREVCRRLTADFDGWRYVGDESGPGLVTKLLVEHGLESYRDDAPQTVDNVTIYPVRFFYPHKYGAEFTEDCVTADSYAVHYWAASWVPAVDPRHLPTMPVADRITNGFARRLPALACLTMRTRVQRAKRLAATVDERATPRPGTS
jgi:mannosyltransferase OCH1-like enzyme